MSAPPFAIVGNREQVHRCVRLKEVLETSYEAVRIDAEDLSAKRARVPQGAAILFVGDHPTARFLRPLIEVGYDRYGVSWGFHDRKAVISVDLPERSDARDVRMRQITREITTVEQDVDNAMRSHAEAGRSTRGSGLELASFFLDVDFAQDEETNIEGIVGVDLEKALGATAWDLGCVTFLRDGFDAFLRRVRLT